MNQFLSGVDRVSIIKATAIYLVIYAIINSCGGILLGIGGAVLGGAGGLIAATGGMAGTTTLDNGQTLAQASAVAAGGGILLVVLGILYLISVPVFAVAAWGLFQRKTWSRMGAVIALGFSILLSVLGLSNGITGVIWIVISVVAIYLFITDAEIKTLLNG